MNEQANIKQKKGTGKTILIVILIILLLGMTGYIIYDKFIKEEPKQKEEVTTKKETKKEKAETFILKNKNALQILWSEDFNVLVSKTGDAYLEMNRRDNIDEQQTTSINTLEKQYKKYPIEGYTECSDGMANEFSGIKLPVSNVIAAYTSQNGQDVFGAYTLFVKEDGTISGLKVDDLLMSGKVTIVDNIDNLKNVVSIVQSSTSGCSTAYQTIAIEKDGTQHILNFDQS